MPSIFVLLDVFIFFICICFLCDVAFVVLLKGYLHPHDYFTLNFVKRLVSKFFVNFDVQKYTSFTKFLYCAFFLKFSCEIACGFVFQLYPHHNKKTPFRVFSLWCG